MRLHDDHELDDARDRALSERLDELGLVDASAAGPMLESRVIAGVAGVFTPRPIAFERAERAWHARAAFRVPFATAAGLALAASVGVLMWPGGQTGPGPVGPGMMNVAMVEQRIDGLLALTADGSGSAEGSFEDRVASIELWADALAADTEHGWLGSDLADPAWYEDGWSDLSGGEGAM